jgi:ribonuclease HI
MMAVIRIYSDGGSRGNPGDSAFGYIICDSNNKILKKNAEFINGESITNNIAEYLGMASAILSILKDKKIDDISKIKLECYSDSKLVINQLSGKWRTKKFHLRKLQRKIVEGIQGFHSVKFKWVPRAHPKIMLADALLNEVLDEKLRHDMGV